MLFGFVLLSCVFTLLSRFSPHNAPQLAGEILRCVRDQNGNHVVQKFVEHGDSGVRQRIVDAFKGKVISLSTHPYGCRVVQRVLEHCTSEQVQDVRSELLGSTETLMCDQYGNYVVQHVLENGTAADVAAIVGSMRGKILLLSQHKYASNVVEKCVTHAAPATRTAMIEEVLEVRTTVMPLPPVAPVAPPALLPDASRAITEGDVVAGAATATVEPPLRATTALDVMIRDPYANYVIQRMLDVAAPAERMRLIELITPQLEDLRGFPYGKHIASKVETSGTVENAV